MTWSGPLSPTLGLSSISLWPQKQTSNIATGCFPGQGTMTLEISPIRRQVQGHAFSWLISTCFYVEIVVVAVAVGHQQCLPKYAYQENWAKIRSINATFSNDLIFVLQRIKLLTDIYTVQSFKNICNLAHKPSCTWKLSMWTKIFSNMTGIIFNVWLK